MPRKVSITKTWFNSDIDFKSRNDNGRHLPVNGPTIGHIIDGVYVPIDKEAPGSVSASSVDLKDWVNVVLCDRLFSDIRKELSAVYSQTDVMKMYCISILRVCDPGVKNYELKEAYETSFLSELYPGIALSKNTVSTFPTSQVLVKGTRYFYRYFYLESFLRKYAKISRAPLAFEKEMARNRLIKKMRIIDETIECRRKVPDTLNKKRADRVSGEIVRAERRAS